MAVLIQQVVQAVVVEVELAEQMVLMVHKEQTVKAEEVEQAVQLLQVVGVGVTG